MHIDSPKRQNKANTSNNKNIRNMSATKRTILSKTKAKSVAHESTLVVVREANKKDANEIDPDIQRLQVISISNLTNQIIINANWCLIAFKSYVY